MGKTISITIPQPLEKELQEEASIQGVSRSRFICNILLTWSENKKNPKKETRNITHEILDSRMK